jgi:polysaccharide biosynthesis protein PelG
VAGIGFELRALSNQHSIASPLVSLAHATWVSSGPLILTAVGLLTVQLLTSDRAGAFETTLFRVSLTYASLLALISASPTAVIVTRLVADCIYAGNYDDIPTLLIGALSLAALVTGITGAVFWSMQFALPPDVAIAAWALSQSIALLWITAVFSGTLKDYAGVTEAFLAGIIVLAGAGVVIAQYRTDAAGMIWCMSAGNMTTSIWLAARASVSLPSKPADPFLGARNICRGYSRFPLLAIGIAAGTAGIWVDKWVMWSSNAGTTVVAGLVYAPLYDSAMFMSFLVVVPALAAFIIHVETGLYTHLMRFLDLVLQNGTLEEIQAAADRLSLLIRSSVLHLFIVQAAVSACAILALPLIVQTFGMQFRQIPIMRLGLLGSIFHLLFLLCGSVLLFINRQRAFCALQVLFLACNGAATWVFLQLGPDYAGMGYFTAAVCCGLTSYFWLDRTLRDLVYLTFASAVSASVRE